MTNEQPRFQMVRRSMFHRHRKPIAAVVSISLCLAAASLFALRRGGHMLLGFAAALGVVPLAVAVGVVTGVGDTVTDVAENGVAGINDFYAWMAEWMPSRLDDVARETIFRGLTDDERRRIVVAVRAARREGAFLANNARTVVQTIIVDETDSVLTPWSAMALETIGRTLTFDEDIAVAVTLSEMGEVTREDVDRIIRETVDALKTGQQETKS